MRRGYPTLTRLFPPGALRVMLWSQGVPLTGFGIWANKASTALCENAQQMAADAGRPCIYLDQITTHQTGEGKDDLARRIAERDGVTEGLVCVFRALEACMSFKLRRNHDTHQLELVRAKRACVHLYFYFLDPEFGFMHVKLQTWLPFQIQIYLNGREWLARQLDAAGVGYLRHDNALLRVDNLQAAYDACERFAHRAWPRVLDAFARAVNPHLPVIRQAGFGSYYWVVDQAEIATDVMFKDRASLAAIMPDLVHHASLNMSSADILRFLGRKVHPSLKAEVVTDTKGRPEGITDLQETRAWLSELHDEAMHAGYDARQRQLDQLQADLLEAENAEPATSRAEPGPRLSARAVRHHCPQ